MNTIYGSPAREFPIRPVTRIECRFLITVIASAITVVALAITVTAPAIDVIACAIRVIAFAISVIAFADHQGCTRNQSDFICNHGDFTRTPPARKNQLHGLVTIS